MLTNRRKLLALTAAGIAAPSILRAQSIYSGKTVKIIVPFPPAGATDVLARLMGSKLSEYWNASVVIENKPGAGGNIGSEAAARSAPDGNTILVVSVGMATNRYLYPRLTYDPVKDLAPSTMIAMVPNILVAGKHVPANSVKELIDYAKANPGKLTYGSSGIGTSVHLSGELFQRLTGTQMVHAPYRGTAQATTDLIGGRIDLIFDNITAAMPQVTSGNVKALGITTAKRSPSVPDLVPVADTVPGFDVTSWFGMWYPAGTPDSFINTLHQDVNRAIKDPAILDRMKTLAAEPSGMGPGELAAFLQSEMTKWGSLITEQKIKIDG